ncbi:hypothetical protein Goshw_026071 [Gossypium schwendimanii]|uniref:DUF7745 domain-containing protein n=1 Tax=Gossypium schwendimanii TaxID=34291 RepID=A0A7J9N5B9_GOSSC|nr:hypothetical protein [Gossypium schwendimanii]
MEKGFLDKVEDSVAILTWSDVIQSEKGDSLAKGYVDNHLFRALAQFWNTTYGCFTFGRVDLVPTVEEYTLYCGVRRFKSTEPTLEL